MIATSAVKNLIRDGRIHLLNSVIRSHGHPGMKSLDEALVDLYFKRIIDGKTLFAYCYDSEEVERLLASQ
jgi:twitching motility protein PilT